MTTFAAELKAETQAAKDDMRYIMVMSIQDVLEGAQTTQRGITQGATSFELGMIPVGLTADLVNSLSVGGATGAGAYVTAIAGMQIGDVLEFEWTMEYSARIEYGFSGTDSLGRSYEVAGRFFVGTNAAKYPEFVAKRELEVSR